MNQYEREKYDDVVNKRLSGIKIYCMSIEFYTWKKNRISSSKAKRSDIHFLTIKKNPSSILFK